jgi:ribose transport system permease protein
VAMASPAIPHKSWSVRLKGTLGFRESGILLALIVLVAALSIVSPAFRSPLNLMTILKQISVTAIVAMGQTLVIISGYFDLSQGSVAGLAAITSAIAAARWGWPGWVSIVFGVVVGAGCGFFNGICITRLKLHPVVVTLASSSIFIGITSVITEGTPVTGVPESFLWIGKGTVDFGMFQLPVPILSMIVVALIMHFLLTQFLFGRRIFIIGSNREAARLAGVNPDRVMLGIFVLSGLLAGLGGVIMVGRVGSALPAIGADMLLPVVAASVIGGTLLSGGVGSMAGTVIGAAVMGVLRNGLVVLRFNIFYQDVVLGFAVLVAVIIDQIRRGNLSLKSVFLGRR